MISVGSLCSGVGGIDLALESLGFTVIWQCDSDPCARAVLAHHWPNVRCYEDVREIYGTAARVDLVCGGPPCQPHSVAGKRKGTEDARWIWPEFARVIGALRPGIVFIENVPGLRSSGLRDVLADLAALGFDAEWGVFSAAEVGAPHIRKRLFVLAYANREGQLQQSGALEEERRRASNGGDEDVADADGVSGRARRPMHADEGGRGRNADPGSIGPDVADADGLRLLRRALLQEASWETGVSAAQGDHPWSVESELGVLADGLSRWLGEHGGLNETQARRVAEGLRDMWDGYVAQAVREAAGRLGPVDAAALLLSVLREHPEGGRTTGDLLEGETPSEGLLRVVRVAMVSTGPPLRRRPAQQRPDEHSNALLQLSHVVAPRGPTPWAVPGWEGGAARVAHGVPGRVDRLRLLGNACVPAQAAHAFRSLAGRALNAN